ncbi:protein MAIN-LIKE 2-like [Lycium barbarum]|uniref:protein MAIN-LIKE 2-like n=1 Tax=Lycium barbarum TaxID=112863 RepID=UPI00293E6355|nr:protein MAIN-LIKE 2-like [Lycium barbarum]
MDRPKVNVHPGPENYDLLILQQQHRSQAVWDGKLTGQNACLTIRRANHEFWNHVRQYPLHNRILNYFERCGFGGVLAVGNVQYDEGIITALIERWRPETHTFHMRTGECAITLQDVDVLYGIPVDGHPLVQRNVKNITKSTWQELMYNLTDLDAIGGKAWGAAALSYLYNCLCCASMANSRDVCGSIVLLQIFRQRGGPLPPTLSGENSLV